jgi:hypothetical protein
VPAAETAVRLRREGLLVRPGGGSLVLFAPAGWRPDGIGPLPLSFWIVFADALFARYTAPAIPPGHVLLADSRNAVREATGEWRLHGDDCAGTAALAPADGLEDARPDRAPLLVRLHPDDVGVQAPVRGVVRLAAVATYWKYYVQGPLAERPVSIVDADGGVRFDRTDDTHVGGSRAAVFLSDRAIALGARPAQRFELHEAAAFGDKVLMKRLPAASAAGCTRAQVEGRAELVSEIFLNS